MVAVPGGEVPPVELARDCWQPVGFGRHEGLLDYSPRSFLGYRLLSEFFAFPEKFLFVELQGVTAALRTRLKAADKLELYVFLDEHHQDLERNVAAQSFRLGCTPLINLFKQRAEPIEYSQHRHEDRVVPDARRPAAHEVYSIDRVVATDRTDREVEIPPLFSIRHEHEGDVPVYWHATRTASPTGEKRADYGTEVMLSIVDLGASPAAADDWTIDVETTCLNRDLPGRLPFGGGQPQLQLTSGGRVGRHHLPDAAHPYPAALTRPRYPLAVDLASGPQSTFPGRHVAGEGPAAGIAAALRYRQFTPESQHDRGTHRGCEPTRGRTHRWQRGRRLRPRTGRHVAVR